MDDKVTQAWEWNTSSNLSRSSMASVGESVFLEEETTTEDCSSSSMKSRVYSENIQLECLSTIHPHSFSSWNWIPSGFLVWRRLQTSPSHFWVIMVFLFESRLEMHLLPQTKKVKCHASPPFLVWFLSLVYSFFCCSSFIHWLCCSLCIIRVSGEDGQRVMLKLMAQVGHLHDRQESPSFCFQDFNRHLLQSVSQNTPYLFSQDVNHHVIQTGFCFIYFFLPSFQ